MTHASRPALARGQVKAAWERAARASAALLFILPVVTGCDADRADGEGAGTEGSALRCETGGDPPSPAWLSYQLAASTAATTPTQIDVCLNEDIDRLSLQTQVFAANGVPATSCITQQLSRVGRHPVDWAVGTVRTVQLDYPEELPAGNYEELVTAAVAVSDYDVPVDDRTARIFEVGANGVVPLTSMPLSSSPGPSEATSAAPEKCPDLRLDGAVTNDLLPMDEAITVVDLDEWRSVPTVQPLRHEVIDVERGQSSILKFSAWNADGDRVRLSIPYRPVSGQAFESREAYLWILGADHVDWSGSGHVVIVDRGASELEVALSDVGARERPHHRRARGHAHDSGHHHRHRPKAMSDAHVGRRGRELVLCVLHRGSSGGGVLRARAHRAAPSDYRLPGSTKRRLLSAKAFNRAATAPLIVPSGKPPCSSA